MRAGYGSQVVIYGCRCLGKILEKHFEIKVVRVEGLEPPRLAAPEPKSGASTNFATPAHPALSAGMTRSITKLAGKCEG